MKRKNDITIKHAKGLDFLMKKNKVTVFNGHGRLTGPAREGVFAIHVTNEDIGKPKDAAGRGLHPAEHHRGEGEEGGAGDGLGCAHAARLHGRRDHSDQYADPDPARDAEVTGGDRVGRGGCRVCLGLQELRRGGHDHRGAAAAGERRRRGSLQGAAAAVQEARLRGLRRREGGQDREEGRRRGGLVYRFQRQGHRPSRRRRSWSPSDALRAPTTADWTRSRSRRSAASS